MSSVEPTEAPLSGLDGSDLVKLEYRNDLVVTYSCDYLVQNNVVTPFELNFYYELVSPSQQSEEVSRRYFEFLLLKEVAIRFGLQDGQNCVQPPENDSLYLVEVSSLPEDKMTTLLPSCIELKASANQNCVPYEGTISGYVLGADDTFSLVNFIANSISSGEVVAGSSLEAYFIGTHIDTTGLTGDGREELNSNAINNEATTAAPLPTDNTFTYIGGLMVAGLCAAFLGFLFVIYRMRQRRQKAWREEAVMATLSREQEQQEIQEQYRKDRVIQLPLRDEEDLDELPSRYGIDDEDSQQHSEQHSYDLGSNMKTSLFAVHGSRSRRLDPPAKVDDSYDSDVDSWAQTDATVGSLEDNRILGDERMEI